MVEPGLNAADVRPWAPVRVLLPVASMTDHIATYLQDHLAGSTLALELLDHLQKAHVGTERENFFAQLQDDIASDRNKLETLMRRLSVSVGTVRAAVAWLGEKVALLKMRMDDSGGGDFWLLEAVELIALGIEGKRALWDALHHVAPHHTNLDGMDFDALAKRAAEQRARIEPVRLHAARAALI
jgi:hypothetical protein